MLDLLFSIVFRWKLRPHHVTLDDTKRREAYLFSRT
jgi:hypothetical protein